ncbi:hypothetical protein ACFQ0D_34955, partial [Micromonospora zhanjiangensis]
GPPARPRDATTRPRVDVSAVVECDGLTATAADRLSTLLVAGAQLRRDDPEPLQIRTAYDETRSRLKVIVLGGAAATADVLRTVHDILSTENDMLPTDPDEPVVPRD